MELGNDGMRHAIQNNWEGVTWLPSYIVRMYEATINKSQTKQVLSMSILLYGGSVQAPRRGRTPVINVPLSAY